MTQLDEVLSDMAKQIRGVWVLAVADNEGMLIGSWQAPDNRITPDLLVGQFVRVIRMLSTMFGEMMGQMGVNLGGGATLLEDIVLTTAFSYLMVRPIGNGYCYLVIDASKDVPLGLLRLAATTNIPKVQQCLPGA